MIDKVKLQQSISDLRTEIAKYDEAIYESYIINFLPYALKRYVCVRVLTYVKQYADEPDPVNRGVIYNRVLATNIPGVVKTTSEGLATTGVKMMIVEKFSTIVAEAKIAEY